MRLFTFILVNKKSKEQIAIGRIDITFPHEYFHMFCYILSVIDKINPKYHFDIFEEYIQVQYPIPLKKIENEKFVEYVTKKCRPYTHPLENKCGLLFEYPPFGYSFKSNVHFLLGIHIYFLQICCIKEMWFTLKANVYISWPTECNRFGETIQISFLIKSGEFVRFSVMHRPSHLISENWRGIRSMFHIYTKWCEPMLLSLDSSKGLLDDVFSSSTTKPEISLFNFCGYKVINSVRRKVKRSQYKLGLPKVLIKEYLCHIVWAKRVFGNYIKE